MFLEPHEVEGQSAPPRAVAHPENFAIVGADDDTDTLPDHEFDEAVDRMVRNTSAKRKKRRRRFYLCCVLAGCAVLAALMVFGRYKSGSLKGPLKVFELDMADCDCPTAEDVLELGEEGMVDDVAELEEQYTLEDLQYGAVATDNPVCSEIGISILRDKGGNAVDAAIAATLCLGVANPVASGIGGGAFILIHTDEKEGLEYNDEDQSRRARRDLKTSSHHTSTKKATSSTHQTSTTKKTATVENIIPAKMTEFIDARETAPQMATIDMMEGIKPSIDADGAIYAAVPGELRGLEAAYERHGSLEWKDLVEPSVKLAKEGVKVTASLAEAISFHHKKIQHYPDLEEIFLGEEGVSMLKEGDILRRPDLALTLEKIMNDGADAFYTGDIAKKLVEDVSDAGGILNMKDMENYRPKVRQPLVSSDIDGFTIATAPPPSSGGAVLIGALRFLNGYSEPFAAFRDALSTHRMVEAMRHTFAMRMSLSDPAFGGKTEEVVKDLMEGSYMEELRQGTKDSHVLKLLDYGGKKWSLLDDEKRQLYHQSKKEEKGSDSPSRTGGLNYLEDRGTGVVSVIDKDKNAVVITSTINTEFGCSVISKGTGVLLNSQMDNFASPGRTNAYGLEPSEANYIAPGKRPLSSMAPTIVFRNKKYEGENQLFMALGASGGPKIISTLLQTFINHAVLGMPLFDSIAYPRVHDQLMYHENESMLYEKKILLQGPEIVVPERTKQALKRRGHVLSWESRTGGCNAVARDAETGLLTAVTDVRKSGRPAGY